MPRIIFLFFLCLASKSGISQIPGDSLQSRTTTGIDPGLLLGYWQMTDTSGAVILFIDSPHEVILNLQDARHPYYFLKDQQQNVLPSGFYPNWPPYNCELHFPEPGILKLTFSQHGVPAHSIRCRRIQ